MNDSEALRKLQMEALDILDAFSSYCNRYNLRWFLLSGTALGALRHDGFIPWDDDVDVGMLRDDYERFLSLAERDFPDNLSVDTPESTKGFAPMFAKVCKLGTRFVTQETMESSYNQGIFIDIIPLDQLAEDKKVAKKQLTNSLIWQSVSYLYHAKTINVPHKGILGTLERFGCKVAHYIAKIALSPSRIVSHYNRSIAPKGIALSNNWMLFSWPHTKPFPTEVLVPTAKHAFDGHRVPVPGKPDDYLTLLYGDWRKLPPADQRHTHMPLRIEFSDGLIWERNGDA